MNKRKAIIFGGAVLIVVALIVYLTRSEPIQVEVVPADRGPVAETVTNTRAGTIKACDRARLAPTIGGQIAQLPVKKGDHVKKNQLLLELWNQDLRAALSLAERDAVAAAARAEQACISADVASRDYQRSKSLVEQGLVSVDLAEKSKGDFDSKSALCRAATQDTKVSQARIDQAQANLERTRLRAPFDGVVAEINGELGEFVTPSPVGIPTPPAIDLVDTRCIYITAPIDEVDAPRIRNDMRASVKLDAFKDKAFPAHVRRVAPYVLEAEKQARTVEVEAELEDHEGLDLLPGYSADLEVTIDKRSDALRIPTRALVQGDGVYVLDENSGRVSLRKIKKGLTNWEYTEVADGLKAGDQVVISIDREGLKDGAKVKATAAQGK
ncbi:MAG TPA: efflux RND transporter periplasmic adaptor subunit [Steroidobacteraceae bacterium]|nr:efflux RND transporter periplasmic adaptor subunit [Steroidobacteraceae bacterium]